MKLENPTIQDVNQSLKEKDFSAVELTESYLEKIKKKDQDVSAFLSKFEDEALDQARQVDRHISEGKEIPLLAGVPVAVKDNMLVEGKECTAGSKILKGYRAPYNATVIKKLRSEQAIIIGKTNMDEFAMGSSTENSAYGPTRNPHDLDHVPGGSSGGSAAAVAADMSVGALGSDTGGSVRQPASFCGTVGFKPTYGAISRYGLIAMASSLDQIGPITKTARDAEIIFDAIKGGDRLDSTSVDKDWTRELGEELVVGVPEEFFTQGLDPKVEEKVKAAIEQIGKEAAIEKISLPHTEYSLAVYYIIMPSEVSANLARYDGIKYGPGAEADNLEDFYSKTRGNYFGEEVRRRIMLGTYALSSGYYEAYYKRAQKVRTLIKNDFEEAFEKVDLIVTPTSPTPAFKFGEKTEDPLSMYLSDVYTASVNLAGLPGLSMPCGEVDNLPVGLQIIGNLFDDYRVLKAAQKFEQVI